MRVLVARGMLAVQVGKTEWDISVSSLTPHRSCSERGFKIVGSKCCLDPDKSHHVSGTWVPHRKMGTISSFPLALGKKKARCSYGET